MTRPPLQVGDRVWVENINISLDDTPELVDAVVTVQRVDSQHCGCWRITCDRAGLHAPGERAATIALYSADCPWPHEDRIDYEAARAAVEGALFPPPPTTSRRLTPSPELAPIARRVRTVHTFGDVL